jgi:DNA-directed RNA polymerase specialized sigma24 family protein
MQVFFFPFVRYRNFPLKPIKVADKVGGGAAGFSRSGSRLVQEDEPGPLPERKCLGRIPGPACVSQVLLARLKQHWDGLGSTPVRYSYMDAPEQSDAGGREAWFGTTHWTVVLSAREGGMPQAAQALETLCRTYWYPLYAYIRRRGYAAPEAQDLTQEFLARLLATNGLASVDRRKGHFRSFLLASLNHFLANEWDRARAAKRGGGAEVLSLDDPGVEARYALEPSTELTPEQLYDRQWALTLLDRALHRLQSEFTNAGKGHQFECLKEFLHSEESERSYEEVGRELGLNAPAVASTVYRLRQRYRELVREEVAHTVPSLGDLDDELRWLFRVLT